MDNELDISILRQACSSGQIMWTTHTLERMQERNIEPSDVVHCISNGKIIEQYPQAYPYPACLILGTGKSLTDIHVVLGYGNDLVYIVTVYEPNLDEWEDGFSTRKE